VDDIEGMLRTLRCALMKPRVLPNVLAMNGMPSRLLVNEDVKRGSNLVD
jgi:hypothetical protein